MHARGCIVYAAVDAAVGHVHIYLFYILSTRVSLCFSPPGRATHRACSCVNATSMHFSEKLSAFVGYVS